MNPTRNTFIHYWKGCRAPSSLAAQIKAVFKGKCAGPVVHKDLVTSPSLPYQVVTSGVNYVQSSKISDSKCPKDVEWHVLLHGLCKGPIACVMQYQTDWQKIWTSIHYIHCETTWRKVTGHFKLDRLNYTIPPVLKYFGRLESCASQLDFMTTPIIRGSWWWR